MYTSYILVTTLMIFCTSDSTESEIWANKGFRDENAEYKRR